MQQLQDILPGVRRRADRLDETGEWPVDDLRALDSIGAMRWAVPREPGGEGVPSMELHQRYESLAAASLVTAFVLSQRDSGVGILVAAEPSRLRDELLTKLSRNEVFTTIGIAHLTTSRQRGAPALRATPVAGGFLLEGEIPWATGSPHCDFICAGAVLDDRRQMLLALPTTLAGVRVQPAMPLMALRASHTASVVCDRVTLPDLQVLVHPSQQPMVSRRKTVPIGQAFLAMGLCRGALDLIRGIDSDAARSAHLKLEAQLQQIRSQVLDFCRDDVAGDPARGTVIRGQVIDLALRTTHAAVSLYKGTGLLAGHPAQRLAREAMFLLVWSCPAPVVDCTLELLTQQGHRAEE
jgi:alkylation response protein AidB-like acyl-CoA dehydrogenase